MDRQHGVVTRRQLLEAGFTGKAIQHRVAIGRLYRIRRGVYAVGRAQLTQHGRWMAAVLSCGPEAALSHVSAGALWEICPSHSGPIHISSLAQGTRRQPGIVLHRRSTLGPEEVTRHHGIPVTTPITTVVDMATCLTPRRLEAAINEADKRDLVDPETLRAALDGMTRRAGIPAVKQVLDRHTFALTDSELERRFLVVVRSAGLPAPQTGRRVNGFKVDFFWPDLGLVVETDGLRYHRTPAQQAKDRLRDQAHSAAGLTPLRFTAAQVTHQPAQVEGTLRAVAERLGSARGLGV